ncbi:Uncharacterised protein [Mycobacteroides abscessus subsp. abscessus]|nr:Uncharacterised protein [Mycobacteroides abscessus subsp. abscessus]
MNRQDGSEILGEEGFVGRVVAEQHRRPDEVALGVVALPADRDGHRGDGLRTVDRGDLLVEGATVDHRAAEVGQVPYIAVGQFGCLAEEVVAHAIPHRARDVRARCGRALLPLILEGAANQGGAQHIRVR